MKLFLVVCCALPAAVLSCSCVENSFNRPRITAIRDDFRNVYNPNIYSAVVIGATCNCRPGKISNATVYCQDYSLQEDGNTVASTLVSGGDCDSEDDFFYRLQGCDTLGSAVTTTGLDVGDVDYPSSPPLGRCSCPFNDDDNAADYDLDYGLGQPCYYTVKITEVFKGNYTNGTVIKSAGPDVLTTCGSPGRFLLIGEQYVVGVGGPCSPISEWSTLNSYSEGEIELLRGRRAYHEPLYALLSIPVILLGCALVVSLIIILCVHHRRRRSGVHRLREDCQSMDDGVGIVSNETKKTQLD